MSDEVKRYEPWPDTPPHGWPVQYVDASDYDALAANLARVEGMLERAMRHLAKHDFDCASQYGKSCDCEPGKLRAEYDKLKAEKVKP